MHIPAPSPLLFLLLCSLLVWVLLIRLALSMMG